MIGRAVLLNLLVAFVLSMGLGSGSAQAQPQVPEIAASDLSSYLKGNDKVVVLFTSPDPKCGFCVGADKGFEQAVGRLLSQGGEAAQWRYVKVQWPRWNQFPEPIKALGVGGVPGRWAFVRASVVGTADGRELDIEHLSRGIVAAQTGQKWSPQPAPAKAAATAAAPFGKPTKEELDKAFDPQNWLRPMYPGWADIQGRRTYLVSLHRQCADRHPGSDARLKPMLNAWAKQTFAVVMDLSQVGWLEREEGKQAVAAQEARFAQALHAQTGLNRTDVLDEAACERLIQAGTAMPLPEIQPPPSRTRP